MVVIQQLLLVVVIHTDLDLVVLAVSDGRPARLGPQLLVQMLEREVRPTDVLLVPREEPGEADAVQEARLKGCGRVLLEAKLKHTTQIPLFSCERCSKDETVGLACGYDCNRLV